MQFPIAILLAAAHAYGSLEGSGPVEVSCTLGESTMACELTFTTIEQVASEELVAFVGLLTFSGFDPKSDGSRFKSFCAQPNWKRFKFSPEDEGDVRLMCKDPNEQTIAAIATRRGWSKTERCVVSVWRKNVTLTRSSEPIASERMQGLWTTVEPANGSMMGCRTDRTISLRIGKFREMESLTITNTTTPTAETALPSGRVACSGSQTQVESYGPKPAGARKSFVKKLTAPCLTIQASVE